MKTIINKEKKVARLQEKENRLVKKGNKAVDEGRERKADRLLGRAARVENRKIKTSEKMKTGGKMIKGKKK
jgi:phage shock protein A